MSLYIPFAAGNHDGMREPLSGSAERGSNDATIFPATHSYATIITGIADGCLILLAGAIYKGCYGFLSGDLPEWKSAT